MNRRGHTEAPLIERAAGWLTQHLGNVMRWVMVRTRDGSAAESGFRLAGFDVDSLRSH